MRVREWTRLALLTAGVGLLALAANAPANNIEEIEARMRRDVTYLASDECEGRGVETQGINKAADYIAAEFKKAGLKPGGPGGSWFQPFTMFAGPTRPKGDTVLKLKGPQGQAVELKGGQDFELHFLSGPGKAAGQLVFVGHGITAPNVKHDDYAGLDVKGKVVVVIRRVPRFASKDMPFGGDAKVRDSLAALQNKFSTAEMQGAAAILLVNDASEAKDTLEKFEATKARFGGAAVPVLHVRRDVIDGLLRSTLGRGLEDIERDIDHDLKPRSAALRGWTAAVEAGLERPILNVKNVVGVLEGSGPLANETVVVGGHYDHLGYGGRGAMGKPPKDKKAIYYGADDNASGTTTVMELARRFGAMKDRQGRRIVFMAFSAEESGLLGSIHYCNKEPLFPLKDTVAMVNLDMVGRLTPHKDSGKDRLVVEGVKTGKGFEELVEGWNKKHDFHLEKRPGNSGYSDHAPFYRKGIPILFFWTETHKDYHRPTDTADKINVSGMRRIADIAQEAVTHFTTQPRPEYLVIKGTGKDPVRPKGKGPTLGLFPDPSDEDPRGVLVRAVTKGRAAEKAGLKEGDVIVELAGKQVRNHGAYTAILQSLQPGREVDIIVLRGKERVTLKVTPEAPMQ